MEELYPPIPPRAEGFLDVGDGHRIRYQEAGNPAGKPVVVLHGGPGSGIAPMARRHFDPAAYRIVLFDQRGSGQSTPGADELSANTLWHLVSDMEKLREKLEIERWQLFGGSWGATLALAYAERHPSRVTEIILRGVFTVRRTRLDLPRRRGQPVPARVGGLPGADPGPRRDDPLAAYASLLEDSDEKVRHRAAVAWSTWEGATVSVQPQESFVRQYAEPAFALTFARLAIHYFRHGAWLEEGQLIRDAGKLAGIPGVLVQGRYDAVCPPTTAHELHRAWPGSELKLLEGAGHAVTDPGVLAALRAATDAFRA